MTKIVRFKAPSGDDMVMLPAAAYDRLVATTEDVEDVAAYDRVKQRLAAGEDEMLRPRWSTGCLVVSAETPKDAQATVADQIESSEPR